VATVAPGYCHVYGSDKALEHLRKSNHGCVFRFSFVRILPLVLVVALAYAPSALAADESPASTSQPVVAERWAIHGQFTYVEQETDSFTAPYAGTNSLRPDQGRETTDATLFLGARLWRGAEIWINPEIDQGFGLDNTLGVAGFPSGEAYKIGKNQPYFRLPRLFVRATVDLAGDRETIEPNANQLGGDRSVSRWVFTVGKMGVADIFDLNQYAHDPRADFLNWAAVDAGSFDYAADAWGYTVGAAAEWYQGTWTMRMGVFDLSNIPNSVHLEPGFHEFQMIAELEKRHTILDRPGKVMITMFDSRGRMGLLDSALERAEATGQPVDIAAVRQYRGRLGASLNLEQQLTNDLGLFARLGKAAGNVEVYEFSDIDRSVVAGLSLKGTLWHREHDTVGVAGIDNGISAERERFLAAGGLGILVGDGQLPHPGPEEIIETYYEATVFPQIQLTLDYQWIAHPAYNLDRGPVSVFAVRFHAQF
jgi:high affinity Mn2+ porin